MRKNNYQTIEITMKKTVNELKKNRLPIFAIASVLAAGLLLTLSAKPAAASGPKMPRKWGPFELGADYKDLKHDLILFKCRAPNAETQECKLIGYPQRDDFVVLKFYREKLAGLAEFRSSADWDKTVSNLKDQLGDPTLPEYQSDRAVAYIWEDSQTYISLTHLFKLGYIVYEIRDRTAEPLYRKSATASSQK